MSNAMPATKVMCCMQVAMQQSATDPTTGTIDMDSILTGMSASDRQAQNHLSTEVLVLLKSKWLVKACCLSAAVE